MDFPSIAIKFFINIIPIISAIYIIVGVSFLVNKWGKKVSYFPLLMFSSAIYSFGYFLEINSINAMTAIINRNVMLIGVVLIPTFIILFISQLTKIKTTIKLKCILYAISSLIWILYLTNPLHSLYYKSIEFVVGEYGGVMITTKGPVNHFLIAYYVSAMIFASIMLYKSYKTTIEKNRRNSFRFLLISFQLSWLTLLFILVGLDKYFDPTPLTIMIICSLFVVNEIKNNMFELQIYRWENIFTSINEPVFLVDTYGEVVCSNSATISLLCELKMSVKDILHDLDNSELNNQPVFFTANNEIVWFEVKKNYFDVKNEYINYMLINITHEKNVSNQKELTNEMICKSEEQYRLLVTQMQQGLAVHEIICDDDGNVIDYRFISVNESYERLTGLVGKDIIGKTVLEILPNTEQYWIDIYGKVALTGEPYQFENYSIELNKYFSVSAYSPKSNQFAVIINDITDKKKIEEEIEFLSYHDQLTGLFNRRYFENTLQKLDSQKYYPLTLVIADVNGLKLTNDAFGHKAGDMLLEKVARILKKECRTEDVVARIGGDEFVIILPETDALNANKIIQRINSSILNEKMDKIVFSISMGYAVKESESDDMNEIFKEAEDVMYRHKLSESTRMRNKTINLIMNSLYENNHVEMLHAKRVSEISEAIATKMNFKEDDIKQIKIASLMHDIGKIGIDNKILIKSQKLNSDEMHEIKRHSEIGYRILSSVNEYSEIAEYVLEHQERWDGKGYPKGIKGDEILLQARIIAIAEAFDSMISYRIYKEALSEEEAVNELKVNAGIQFDPDISKFFVVEILGKKW